MSEEQDSAFRILVATDTHLGYAEKHPERGKVKRVNLSAVIGTNLAFTSSLVTYTLRFFSATVLDSGVFPSGIGMLDLSSQDS